MNYKLKSSDVKLQIIQKEISEGLATFAIIANEMKKWKIGVENKDELMKRILVGSTSLVKSFNQLSAKRKLDIKPCFHAEYSGICSNQFKTTEFLFGDNIVEALKSSRSVSSVVKNATQPQKQRFLTRGLLNYRRPHFSRGRGGYSNRRGIRGFKHTYGSQQTFRS